VKGGRGRGGVDGSALVLGGREVNQIGYSGD